MPLTVKILNIVEADKAELYIATWKPLSKFIIYVEVTVKVPVEAVPLIAALTAVAPTPAY